MRLFVAAETSGEEREFSWTIPGELVHFPPVVCDCPDCGCERAMAGFVSHKATSAFVVRDLDIDPATFTQLLWETLRDGGWVTEGDAEDRAWVEEWAQEHIEVAASFPVETPLRMRDCRVMVRSSGRSA